MKNLLTTLFFTIATLHSFAQYPLPDTRVYGSLQVDSNFICDFQGYQLINDTLSNGVFSIPMAGAKAPSNNSGFWVNSIADWSAIGGRSPEIRIGVLDAARNIYTRIDTTQILNYVFSGATSENVSLSITLEGVEVKTTTAAFYPPSMTATEASALTPSNGAMIYVTTTDATFTTTGFWGYVSGAWIPL